MKFLILSMRGHFGELSNKMTENRWTMSINTKHLPVDGRQLNILMILEEKKNF